MLCLTAKQKQVLLQAGKLPGALEYMTSYCRNGPNPALATLLSLSLEVQLLHSYARQLQP